MGQIIHVIDAFTDKIFAGNSAAVCVLEKAADETWMRLLAREMNLSETAFVWPIEGGWSLRWFTPAVEVRLCGHATLGSAFAMWKGGHAKAGAPLRFHTLSGWLTCEKNGEWIEMDFPALEVTKAEPPQVLLQALGLKEAAIVGNVGTLKWFVEVDNEAALRAMKPDFALLSTLPVQGTVVTSRSEDPKYDFVSRYFAPAVGIHEDPATGSAHCALGPYWGTKLGKTDLVGLQASERSGVVKVSLKGDRVLLGGQAVSVGKMELSSEAPGAS